MHIERSWTLAPLFALWLLVSSCGSDPPRGADRPGMDASADVLVEGAPDSSSPDASDASDTGAETGTDTGEFGDGGACPMMGAACVEVAPPPAGACAPGSCLPLMVADLSAIETAGLADFDARGQGAKSLTLCEAEDWTCTHQAESKLGTIHARGAFIDGRLAAEPVAAMVVLAAGDNSDCANPMVNFSAGAGASNITLVHDGGVRTTVYFPPMCVERFALYVGSDGSTFYNAGLSQVAQRAPAP